MASNVPKVVKNIESLYDKRKALVYALCLNYAARARRNFRRRQSSNAYWNNRTKLAMDTVFSRSYKDDNEIGFFLAHTQQYGVYLELANDRQNEALRPVMNKLLPKFKKDLKRIYEG